jgi:hypothetical protein
MRRTAHLLALAILAAASAALVLPDAASAETCRPVVNPYEGTRYEGVDLSHIRAEGVSCSKARRVARGAHRRALAAVPNANGIVRVNWNGWAVTGDLVPSHDRYSAKRRGRVVRWEF